MKKITFVLLLGIISFSSCKKKETHSCACLTMSIASGSTAYEYREIYDYELDARIECKTGNTTDGFNTKSCDLE